MADEIDGDRQRYRLGGFRFLEYRNRRGPVVKRALRCVLVIDRSFAEAAF
jgi:hypothetical protein